MKVIIAGSRSVQNYDIVKQAIEDSGFLPQITEVVSGTARGVDRLGERWAKENGISVRFFPANWKKYGKKAGMIRNAEMAEYADALIAIWDNESPGTANMIRTMEKLGKKFYVKITA